MNDKLFSIISIIIGITITLAIINYDYIGQHGIGIYEYYMFIMVFLVFTIITYMILKLFADELWLIK